MAYVIEGKLEKYPDGWWFKAPGHLIQLPVVEDWFADGAKAILKVEPG